MLGTLKNWDDHRGLGIITPDEGRLEFFAVAKYFAPGVAPVQGMRVTFEIIGDDRTDRGLAENIQALPPVQEQAPGRRTEGKRKWLRAL